MAHVVANDDQLCRCLTGVLQNFSGVILYAIGNGKADDTEQIGSTIDHPPEPKGSGCIYQLHNMCVTHINWGSREEVHDIGKEQVLAESTVARG